MSSERRPMFCKNCREAAFLTQSAWTIPDLLTHASFYAAIGVAVFAQSWLALAIFPLTAILAYILGAYFHPLAKIAPATFDAMNFRLPPRPRKSESF